MANTSKTVRNPAAEYLFKIQLIVSNSEFMNHELAAKYETLDTKLAGDAYVRAVLHTDMFESYTYDPKHIYSLLQEYGVPEDKLYLYINNILLIPPKIKKILMDEQREILISKYVEKNKYYCNLAGIPFSGNDSVPADRIITIPDEFYYIYQSDNAITQNQPIHTMPLKYQELFMNSKYYDEVLKKYPDAVYLKYIGSNSIPIELSRKTMDGNILKINTDKLHTYHKTFGNVTVSYDMVHLFSNVYQKTRDYVYNTLRGDFSQVYPNYNNFIRFLTIYMAMGQTLNECMKKSNSMAYMNNATANNFFVLYGLPSVIMEGQSMIDFLKKLRLLLMDKGTNVVYRVKDIIGYKYTDIYTLVMVKQQVFEKGIPKYTYDDEGNPTPVSRIVFRRLGTTDDNTSYFKFRDSGTEYPWEEIASGDPRWWNTPEVEEMLYDMNYTLSNSKYIQLSTHMSMSDVYWQTIIFLRGILDSRKETQFSQININMDLGESEISVFDAVLTLIILMNWNTSMTNGKTFSGELFTYNNATKTACIDMLFNGLTEFTPNELKPGLPFKISSFNFNIRDDRDFYNSINDMDYLQPDVFIPMLENVLDNKNKNVGEMLMVDAYSIYKYLETKLTQSRTIHEFRQVTDIFNHLFLVDPVRNSWFDFEDSDATKALLDMYDISYYELSSLMNFCDMNNLTVRVAYENDVIDVDLGYIMNNNAYTYEYEIDGEKIKPFESNAFVISFESAMMSYTSNEIRISNLSNSIKMNYQKIISDKVMLDIGQTTTGPKTFDSLLFRHNPSLYRRLISMKNDGSNLIMYMRSIVKGLENYTNSDLSALEFSAIGESEYMNILKEVISYFKSYMVEFTKEEFAFIMDGLFDNGGNSNMLRLYDEIVDSELEMHVTDSLTMYDVSYSEIEQTRSDDEVGVMYDSAIIRAETTYGYLKTLGYDIWFDDGNRITKNVPESITDDTEVIGTLIQDNINNEYRIIIPTKNIE